MTNDPFFHLYGVRTNLEIQIKYIESEEQLKNVLAAIEVGLRNEMADLKRPTRSVGELSAARQEVVEKIDELRKQEADLMRELILSMAREAFNEKDRRRTPFDVGVPGRKGGFLAATQAPPNMYWDGFKYIRPLGFKWTDGSEASGPELLRKIAAHYGAMEETKKQEDQAVRPLGTKSAEPAELTEAEKAERRRKVAALYDELKEAKLEDDQAMRPLDTAMDKLIRDAAACTPLTTGPGHLQDKRTAWYVEAAQEKSDAYAAAAKVGFEAAARPPSFLGGTGKLTDLTPPQLRAELAGAGKVSSGLVGRVIPKRG
jgi:hypothetical protein